MFLLRIRAYNIIFDHCFVHIHVLFISAAITLHWGNIVINETTCITPAASLEGVVIAGMQFNIFVVVRIEKLTYLLS